MHISCDMIHPELRAAARLIRLFLPAFTLRKLKAFRRLVRLLRGRHTRRLRYEQKYLPRPDGSRLRLCIYTPLEPAGDAPGILWLHGGGYAFGAPEQDEVFIRRCIDAGVRLVVSPDYTLSVDAPYPAALEDCYAALVWMKEHGKEYGMRENQIMVGGDSAGGGLAAALTLYARDKKEVAIAFQLLLYPMLDDRMNTESARDNDAPLWNSRSNGLAWRLYLGELFGRPDVPAYAAPARAADLSGLPPACSYVGGIEPFRDETVDYMDRLRGSGVPVHFKVFDGCYHGFDIAGGGTGVAREAISFFTATLRYAAANYFAEQPR